MLLNTKYFGEVQVDSAKILKFKLPIYGFEDYVEFVPLTDSDIGESIILLQSITSADLCFVLTDSRVVSDSYNPSIPVNTLTLLEKNNILNASFWFVTVLGHEFKDSTVNMKSPILIDFDNNSAAQIILDDDLPIRAPLVIGQKGA